MSMVKVLRNGQITVPKGLRRVLRIKEGDILEVSLEKAGVLLKPKALVDKESVLSKKGQTKLREALEEYKAGKVKSFRRAQDLIEELNS